MDIPEILSYCKSSKRFNETVCKNDSFWYYKLKLDYNIDRKKKYSVREWVKKDPNQKHGRLVLRNLMYGPKEYYQYITKFLHENNDIQKTLENAVLSNDLDKLKAVIKQGADINNIPSGRNILYYPLISGNLEMAKYIVNYPRFDRKQVPDLLNPENSINAINLDKKIVNNPRIVYEYLVNEKILKSQ